MERTPARASLCEQSNGGFPMKAVVIEAKAALTKARHAIRL
jgi:hypothetical protein